MPAPADWPEWLGLKQIAEVLHVKRHTPRMWRHRGELPDPDIEQPAMPLWRRETIWRWARNTNRLPQ